MSTKSSAHFLVEMGIINVVCNNVKGPYFYQIFIQRFDLEACDRGLYLGTTHIYTNIYFTNNTNKLDWICFVNSNVVLLNYTLLQFVSRWFCSIR